MQVKDEKLALASRAEAYALMRTLLRDLPTAEAVARLRASDWELLDGPGGRLILSYFTAHADATDDQLALELGRERAKLLRGTDPGGPRPPYESLFSGRSPADAAQSVSSAYRAAGFTMAEDALESPEQLGVEFSFMQGLMNAMTTALEEGDEAEFDFYANAADKFHEQHLRPFALAFADELEAHALSDFYRGLAHLLRQAASN